MPVRANHLVAGDKSSRKYKTRNTFESSDKSAAPKVGRGPAPRPRGGAAPATPSAGGRRSPKRLTSLPVCSAPPAPGGGLATFAEDDSANVESGIWNQIPRMWKPESGIGFHECRKSNTSHNKSGGLSWPPLSLASRYYSHLKIRQGGRSTTASAVGQPPSLHWGPARASSKARSPAAPFDGGLRAPHTPASSARET